MKKFLKLGFCGVLIFISSLTFAQQSKEEKQKNADQSALKEQVLQAQLYARAYNFIDAEALLNKVIAKDSTYAAAYLQLSMSQKEHARSNKKDSVLLNEKSLKNRMKYNSIN